MPDSTDQIFVTITEAQPIHVTMTETEIIRVAITTSGAQGPQGAAGPNSHVHKDPLAISRVMEYVEPFKAYVITEE